MEKLFGPVYTAGNLAELYRFTVASKSNAAKVVTGWGANWSFEALAALYARQKNVVVRSVAGDPSAENGAKPQPEWALLEPELLNWLRVAPNGIFEIGNEPNLGAYAETVGDGHIWAYRWHLINTATAMRNLVKSRGFDPAQLKLVFPMPALKRKNTERWLQIISDAAQLWYDEEKQIPLYDYIGAHVYEHFDFKAPRPSSTGEWDQLMDVYYRYLRAARPLLLTEVGINDPGVPKLEKLERYRWLNTYLSVAGTFFFHLDNSPDGGLFPNYALDSRIFS